MKTLFIIIMVLLWSCFVLSLVWYANKKKCLDYQGETEGRIIKVTKRSYSEGIGLAQQKRTAYAIKAVYEVDGRKYNASCTFSDEEKWNEGDSIKIRYDAFRPKNHVFLQEIKDEKIARMRWAAMVAVVFILCLGITYFVAKAMTGFDTKDVFDKIEGPFFSIILISSYIEVMKYGKFNLDLKRLFIIPIAAMCAFISVTTAFTYDDLTGSRGLIVLYSVTCGIYALLTIVATAAYTEVKRRMSLSSEMTGIVASVTDYDRNITSAGENNFHQNVTAVYEADGQLRKARVFISDLAAKYQKGDEIKLLYDENKPQRVTFADLAQNRSAVLKNWKVIPLTAFAALLLTSAAMFPVCFGLSPRFQYISLIAVMAVALIFTVPAAAYIIMKNGDSKGKKALKSAVLVIATLLLIVFIFFGILISLEAIREDAATTSGSQVSGSLCSSSEISPG